MRPDWRSSSLRFVLVVMVVAVVVTCGGARASELDYLGLELGATWLYSVMSIERELDVGVSQESGSLKRQVGAIEVDSETGSTTYTIQETWTTNDETKHSEYKLTKTSTGEYYARDGEQWYLIFDTPLEKGTINHFSLALWEEWGLKIWGQAKRETPLGADNAWVAKEWREYGDGSYVELTMEFVPHLGFLYEAKHERLFLEDCS